MTRAAPAVRSVRAPRLATARRAACRTPTDVPRPALRAAAKRGFTLIEMLVATVLSAVLMAALLAVVAGVARDRRLVPSLRRATADPALDLLEWDLRNARTAAAGTAPDVLVLVGNDGIDRDTLAPDGRLVRVAYRTAGTDLWRCQAYLDDPARPAPWQERVAGDFRSLTLAPPPGPPDAPAVVPARVRLGFATGVAAGDRQVDR